LMSSTPFAEARGQSGRLLTPEGMSGNHHQAPAGTQCCSTCDFTSPEFLGPGSSNGQSEDQRHPSPSRTVARLSCRPPPQLPAAATLSESMGSLGYTHWTVAAYWFATSAPALRLTTRLLPSSRPVLPAAVASVS